VEAVCRALGATVAPCATATTRLDGGHIERFDTFLADARARATPDVPAALIERLVFNYGTAWTDVIRTGVGSGESGVADMLRPLGSINDAPGTSDSDAGCDVTGAEILYAVREEMAVTLADALLRRTEAGTRGHPGRAAVEAAATLMASELGWSAAQRAKEIQALARVYEAAATRGN